MKITLMVERAEEAFGGLLLRCWSEAPPDWNGGRRDVFGCIDRISDTEFMMWEAAHPTLPRPDHHLIMWRIEQVLGTMGRECPWGRKERLLNAPVLG